MAWYVLSCRSRTPAYQVRFAVRDRHPALGSVGEFVQIDDVAKGIALSGIVIGENNART
jgi:hypothetical protein